MTQLLNHSFISFFFLKKFHWCVLIIHADGFIKSISFIQYYELWHILSHLMPSHVPCPMSSSLPFPFLLSTLVIDSWADFRTGYLLIIFTAWMCRQLCQMLACIASSICPRMCGYTNSNSDFSLVKKLNSSPPSSTLSLNFPFSLLIW